jgi:putative DNA primase/helicase
VSGDDPAVWRRILVVPFDVVIPEAERDGRLPGRLKESDASAAILAWLYVGYLDYLDGGLRPPQAVRARTDAYHADSNLTGRFLTECVEKSANSRTTAKDLYARYEAWFRAEAGKDDVILPKGELGKDLAKLGWASVKTMGVIVYRGMSLIADTASDLE